MKTKILTLVAFTLLFFAQASAQDAMLTKEETVNYLHKKLQEVDGRDYITKQGEKVRYSNLSFQRKGDNLELKYTEQVPGKEAGYSIFIFNSAHISTIGLLAPRANMKESPVWGLRINFGAKTVRTSMAKTTIDFSDGDVVYFPYFAAVPNNHLRIEKALLHLRDLAKAEDEPFGN